MEDRLPSTPAGKFYKAASVVDYNNSQQKVIVSAALTLGSKFKSLCQGRTYLSSSVEITSKVHSSNDFL